MLNTNVSELTPEQLRALLEQNKPVIQQITAILIDEASKLLLGLSDVCSKIAMDWVQNILPGLVKSAAIGVPSAVEAAIPPLGEVVDIVNTGLALLAAFMKIIGAFQRNFDTASEGYGRVKDAYTSLQKVKDLLSQSPGEILKNATNAVITPENSFMANKALKQLVSTPYTSPATAAASQYIRRGGMGGGGQAQQRHLNKKKNKSRKYIKNTTQFNKYISNSRRKTAKKELQLLNSIRELKSI